MRNNKTINYHSLRGNIIYQTKVINNLIFEGKVKQARLMVEDLIKTYPNDYHLLYTQLKILAFEGKLEQAYDIAKTIPVEEEKNYYYYLAVLAILNHDFNGMEYYYNKYFKSDKYHREISENVHTEAIRIYLQKIFEPNKEETPEYLGKMRYSYNLKQVMDYNLEDAYRHITNSHVNSSKSTKTIFNPSIDIKKLMDDVKELIENNQGTSRLDNLQEIYYIYYPECGKFVDSASYNLNHLIASTIYNTSDILTIYPVRENSFNEPLTFPPKNEDVKALKRVSQIDKFNMRYGKK